MSNRSKDQLFRLIKSLTKAEKRSFRLYANRTMSDQERKFVALFDLLDRLDEFDEEQVRRKLPGHPSRGQLANLKRHLYRQLLTSLRVNYIQKNIDIQLREQLDFARILYSKGLYMDALRILERSREVAARNHQDILHLEVLEFLKLIEARHITRSRQVDRKMDRLLQESTLRSMVTHTASELANLNIQIHGYYIVYGHAVTPESRQQLEEAWEEMRPEPSPRRFTATFFEQVHRFQSYMWYRYILLDFDAAREHAYEWVNLFNLHPQMRYKDPDLFMRGIYYLLVFLLFSGNEPAYRQYLRDFDHFLEAAADGFNPNSQHIAFVYHNMAWLNYHFLRQDHDAGQARAARIKAGLADHRDAMDPHRLMLFYYKFAYLAFRQEKYDQALEELKQLLLYRQHILRKEMDINARLLQVLCLLANGDYDVADARLTSLSRSLGKSKEATPAQRMSLRLVRDLIKAPEKDRPTVVKYYDRQFRRIEPIGQELKARLYLDVYGWVKEKYRHPRVET
jgi:hypothetical protein